MRPEDIPRAADTQLTDQLLNARSRIMAQRIAAILAEDPGRPRFFALGAGHLPGDQGIVALLRARGLDVRRVRR